MEFYLMGIAYIWGPASNGGKGFFFGLMLMSFLMTGGLASCSHDKDNLKKDLAAEDVSGAEIERLGDVYFNQGNLELALMQYNKYLRDNPDNARVVYKKGMLFLKGKADEAAIIEFRKVIKIDPIHAQAYQGLGQAYFRLKKNPEASYDGSILP